MTTFILFLGFFAGSLTYHLSRKDIESLLDGRSLDEQHFDVLNAASALIGKLFGPNAKIAFVKERGKVEEIRVECRHCGARNRLHSIERAVCGNCKGYLCVQFGEELEAPKQSTMNVN